MSETSLLVVGLVSMFAALAIGGSALAGVAGDRRRARMLQTQLGQVQADLWERSQSEPFAERAFRPFLSGLRSIGGAVTPAGLLDKIRRQLVLAGSPRSWDAEKVAALMILCGPVVGAGAWGLTGLVALSSAFRLACTATGVFAGAILPITVLSHAAAARQLAMRRALPDTLDLLTISVEAGLGLNAAIAQVVHNVPGPLSEEYARMLQEMNIGVARADAFRNLGTRTDVEELQGFTLAMVQADIFGISIGNVLRVQARELRIKRRQTAEEKAQKLPLKILIPLIFCILPFLFIVIAGPGVIRVIRTFFVGISVGG